MGKLEPVIQLLEILLDFEIKYDVCASHVGHWFTVTENTGCKSCRSLSTVMACWIIRLQFPNLKMDDLICDWGVGDGDQVAALFDEWAIVCEAPGATDKAYAGYMSQLQHSGMLKGDDTSDRFFRILIV
jgi:hypothetical protein